MTVTPVSDPCVGNLATPVNSGYFIKGLINNLPLYRPGISPNFRGLETGAAFGYLLYGPFTICGPLRATEYQQTAGLLAAIGAVHILSLLFLLYNQPGKQPNIPPPPPHRREAAW
jgi:photosystem I subunit 11